MKYENYLFFSFSAYIFSIVYFLNQPTYHVRSFMHITLLIIGILDNQCTLYQKNKISGQHVYNRKLFILPIVQQFSVTWYVNIRGEPPDIETGMYFFYEMPEEIPDFRTSSIRSQNMIWCYLIDIKVKMLRKWQKKPG